MIDESKLIFLTGAPGCKWSATAHLITFNQKYPINKSDYNKERFFHHSIANVAHQGAYWGPGNGLGEKFANLSSLSKKEILEEIDKPYGDKSWNKYRIIKCHQFSLNLDFIKETFPKSKILIVLRPDKVCYFSWLSAGGFESISYPNYSLYYKNKELLFDKIVEENQCSRNFIKKHNLNLNIVTERYWKDFWNIDNTNEELDTYMKSIEGFHIDNVFKLSYDVIIADYNF